MVIDINNTTEVEKSEGLVWRNQELGVKCYLPINRAALKHLTEGQLTVYPETLRFNGMVFCTLEKPSV